VQKTATTSKITEAIMKLLSISYERVELHQQMLQGLFARTTGYPRQAGEELSWASTGGGGASLLSALRTVVKKPVSLGSVRRRVVINPTISVCHK
jgi:hypothetical protein